MEPQHHESQYMKDNIELSGVSDIFDYEEGIEGAFEFPPLQIELLDNDVFQDITSQLFVSEDSSSFGNLSGQPISGHTDSFTTSPVDFGEPNGHSWMNDDLLQLPSPIQPGGTSEIYDDYNLPVTSSGAYMNQRTRSISYLAMGHLENRRQLPRRRSRYRIERLGQSQNAMPIPPHEGPADPLERWKESPPEVEAASLTAIKDALETSALGHMTDGRPNTPGLKDIQSRQHHRSSTSRAASTTSGESVTSASSQCSNQSSRSASSYNSRASGGRKSSGIRKRRTDTSREKRSSANNPRIFCCTFCCDKFKSKYDWVRHEKSLHLNLESWVCTPFGGSVIFPSTGRYHCAYCSQLDPTREHLEKHSHGLCRTENRPCFRRKDHLIQHLRLFHRLDTIPPIDDWKQIISDFTSRCGFCSKTMSNWNERADHLTGHFRNGCTMASWKGDHQFPPDIALEVAHSVPPYLIDFESRTLVPFSATNGEVNDHLSQMLSRARFEKESNECQPLPMPTEGQYPLIQSAPTSEEPRLDSYTEVLTRHLSHYAQKMMTHGIIPTDEMFQSEARRLLFDSDDQWNQTLADNHEWLSKFRKEQNSPTSLEAAYEPCWTV